MVNNHAKLPKFQGKVNAFENSETTTPATYQRTGILGYTTMETSNTS